jgi:methyl coenzyme M reductase gamma subunit
MALQWSGDTAPAFVPTRPVRVGGTKVRDNGTLAHMDFTIVFAYDQDNPPQPDDTEVIGWFQPIHDAMKAAGWEFHTFTQEAPPAARSIQEV